MWGWVADYPDPENFLFLLWGPMGRSASGGPNTANFANAAYDELFLNLNSTDWGADSGFDQNRLFVGLNPPLDSARSVQAELGYLNRYLKPSSRRGRMDHIVSVNLLLSY